MVDDVAVVGEGMQDPIIVLSEISSKEGSG